MGTGLTREVHDISEASYIVGMSRCKLERLIKEGKGPKMFREGGRPRFLRRELLAWLEA